MASKDGRIIRIQVKNGDALASNRLEGKSNTGTYFIGSYKDKAHFECFLKEDIKYVISSKKVIKYCSILKTLMKEKRFEYKDGMYFLKDYENILSKEDTEVEVGIRVNDVRWFMRFKDNNEIHVDALRHILYANVSQIVLELIDNICYVYPDVEDEYI